MKTQRFFLIGVAVAVLGVKPVPLLAEEKVEESAKLPRELAATMAEYVSRRNLALVEFNRVYLEKFAALESKYQQEGQEETAKAVHNKIVELKKEIERLRAAPAGGFILLEARYGSEEQAVDCLEPLLGQVRENRLRITVKPATIGLKKDPHFGVRKTLTVKYLWNDAVRTATARDGQLLEVPGKNP